MALANEETTLLEKERDVRPNIKRAGFIAVGTLVFIGVGLIINKASVLSDETSLVEDNTSTTKVGNMDSK